MKKNLFGLSAISIAIIASAFNYTPKPQTSNLKLMWFGDPTPSMDNLITLSEDPYIEDLHNCIGQGNPCEWGFLPTDFVIDGDPDSGLEPDVEPFILESY